jgi:tellurite resistance protein TerC
MTSWWSGTSALHFWVLVGFHVFVVSMLALDLGVLQRKAHRPSMKEAAAWSLLWISLALLFALGIWKFWPWWEPTEPTRGGEKALEFVTGYLVELSLSVDNLFVFLVIFRYFGVPGHLQHRVLFWGILGAVIMRATFILAGAALLHYFHWMIYIFGAFLIYTGYKLFRSVEEEIDPGRNPLLRLARRFFPVLSTYDTPHFWVLRDGRWHLTPLPLVLLVVESTDVVFAIDSIPAIFGITQDTFIVYTSNIFAILGLRALFFLLANFLGMFRYLSVGLALVLAFVGLKMLLEEPLRPFLLSHGIAKQQLILISLGVIALILTLSVVASVLVGPKEPLEHPAEAVTEEPPAAVEGADGPASDPGLPQPPSRTT